MGEYGTHHTPSLPAAGSVHEVHRQSTCTDIHILVPAKKGISTYARDFNLATNYWPLIQLLPTQWEQTELIKERYSGMTSNVPTHVLTNYVLISVGALIRTHWCCSLLRTLDTHIIGLFD